MKAGDSIGCFIFSLVLAFFAVIFVCGPQFLIGWFTERAGFVSSFQKDIPSGILRPLIYFYVFAFEVPFSVLRSSGLTNYPNLNLVIAGAGTLFFALLLPILTSPLAILSILEWLQSSRIARDDEARITDLNYWLGIFFSYYVFPLFIIHLPGAYSGFIHFFVESISVLSKIVLIYANVFVFVLVVIWNVLVAAWNILVAALQAALGWLFAPS